MQTIRTRIAPSPTGFLHIGTARTALFNYLFAKKQGGTFILRIEDTDLERSDSKYEKDILENLAWLGIEPDESPIAGGSFGPYRQSERIESYKKYVERLLADGKAFYCFHSEKELEEEKTRLLEAKRPPLHLCEFRTLDSKEAEALTETKSDYVIRFKTPGDRLIVFRDLIHGELSFESSLLGDFSIAKRPDVPLFNFAVAVDDFEMKITHVIRGEDHISNTPKQLLLIEALNFPTPHYAHLPLILGPDRSKLSKRHGATSVGEYRREGYLPETLFNFMALLGWNPGDNRELMSRGELIREFSLEKVKKSGAIFDIKKLDWMNGEYIRKKPVQEFTELLMPFFPSEAAKKNKEYLQKIAALEQPRLKKLSEIREHADYFFKNPAYDKQLLRWKLMSDEDILESLNRSEKIISESEIENFDFNLRGPYGNLLIRKDGTSVSPGEIGPILWPLRVALTGKKASPGPSEIMEILGKEETIERIKSAKKLFIA
jgi:glutamyl-tRNA synthetase